ncbi:MAG TPA: NIPSNAP family protein [Hanamia sp.]
MKVFCIIFSLLVFSQSIYSSSKIVHSGKGVHKDSKSINNDFFQIRVYHLKNDEQVKMTDDFLKDSYLPALHRFGIKDIGVFKPISNDTASVKLIYVLIPFSSSSEWMKISERIESDAKFQSSAKSFLQANSTGAPYERMESILLEAFPKQPFLLLPKQKNPEQVFELRSYESPTEHLAKKKMNMFNKDEINIFNRLKFYPVFYGKVVSGSRMPNLMYMPVFKSVEDRNAQWKIFGDDPKWKEISADPVNENNVSVSHIDSILMHSTSYSDY